MSSPKAACLAEATRRVRAAKNLVTSRATTQKPTKIIASGTLMVSITATAPTTVSAEMRICRRPRWSTSETLSRSLVARLMVSPGWWLSK